MEPGCFVYSFNSGKCFDLGHFGDYYYQHGESVNCFYLGFLVNLVILVNLVNPVCLMNLVILMK